MENSTFLYRSETEEFLKRFELCWDNAVTDLAIEHPQLRKGSRLRPQICFWGYLATTLSDEHRVDYCHIAETAVSIELVHKASLIIDDWIDNDEKRHGLSALHVDIGPQQAVLIALNMIGYSLERLKKVFTGAMVLPNNYYLCLETIINTIYSMARGALQEIRGNHTNTMDVNSTHEIIRLETAKIIGNSLLLGYYAGVREGNVDHRIEQYFGDVGDQSGYLFQVLNDLEPFVNPESLIKHKGSLNYDFQVNRKNIVVSSLYELANNKDRNQISSNEITTLVRLVKKYHVVQTLYKEIEAVYSELLRLCTMGAMYGLSPTWCEGFQQYIRMLREYAESRLVE